MLKKAKPFAFETVKGDPFPNSDYYVYGDYKIHYRVDPAKTVTPAAKAFMVHGFACNTRFYDEMVERLTAAGVSCLRIDLPDFGFSTREYKGIDYVPQTKILHQMMEDFDEDGSGWILFGHSMGGSVAMQMTIEEKLLAPEDRKIAATVLYAPLVMADSPQFLRKIMKNGPVGAILEAILPFVTPYEPIWKAVGYMMTFDWPYTKAMDNGVYRDPLQVKNMGHGLAFMTAVAVKPDIDEMEDVSVPVQFIIGGRDLFVMPNVAFKMWKKMPKCAAKKLFLSGGHCFLQNQADRTFAETSSFLKKNGLL